MTTPDDDVMLEIWAKSQDEAWPLSIEKIDVPVLKMMQAAALAAMRSYGVLMRERALDDAMQCIMHSVDDGEAYDMIRALKSKEPASE